VASAIHTAVQFSRQHHDLRVVGSGFEPELTTILVGNTGFFSTSSALREEGVAALFLLVRHKQGVYSV